MLDVISTFKALAQISSPSYQEEKIAHYIMAILEQYDIEYWQDNGHHHYLEQNAQCGNIIAMVSGDKSQTIALCAHMDTVQPCDNITVIDDGKWLKTDGNSILGGDDKAGIAVILDTLISCKLSVEQDHVNLIAIFTFAEEVGLKGAKVLDFSLLPPIDYAYVIDASGSVGNVVIGAPFSAKGIVTINGHAGHACEPESGCNAMLAGAALIQALPIGRINDYTTSNIGMINGGIATNIIMPSVNITLEVRSKNEDEVKQFIALINEILIDLQYQYPITFINCVAQGTAGFMLSKKIEFLKKFEDVCKQLKLAYSVEVGMGGSDANIFNQNGIPCANISIGMEKIHTANERIRKSDILDCQKLIHHLIR